MTTISAPAVRAGVLFEELPTCFGHASVDLTAARERAWHLWQSGAPAPRPPVGAGREEGMDHKRARQAHAREGDLIAGRRQAHDDAEPRSSSTPTVVVGHRHAWHRDRLAGLLSDSGMQVLCASDSAIDVVAAVVAEQPDLVFLTDHLCAARGPELLARAQLLCPGAVYAVQVEADMDAHQVNRAGVSAIYARAMRPGDIADALVRLVTGQPQAMTDQAEPLAPQVSTCTGAGVVLSPSRIVAQDPR